MSRREPITEEAANEIYDALIEHAGCYKPVKGRRDPYRGAFVRDATEGFWTEYRFQGSLGFGGKVWNRHDRWDVNCYHEDETPARTAAIEATNEALAVIFQKHYDLTQS